jgi:hypothetical protein
MHKRTRSILVLSGFTFFVAIVIAFIMIMANTSSKVDIGNSERPEDLVDPVYLEFDQPYVFNKEGYEPSIAVDSTGALYYTAHKNLDDKDSWDYLASWFFVSTNNGKSWESPTDPFPLGKVWQTYLSDEGDIAVDGRDNVYFVDTYLIDNHIHVWSNQGQYEYSVRFQKTSGLDDRPWITAQNDGILHYLGNNAVEVNGGRYWYYRSTNGGRTFSRAEPVPGNGWAHIDCERNGDHAYVVSESQVGGSADILMYVSDDGGRSWNWNDPIKIGERDGPGRQYPIVSAQDDGVVWVMWNEAQNGVENGTQIFVGRSLDHGNSWESWNITPFQAFIDYPTINVGPGGALGVAFYATDDLPVGPDSEWYLYGAMDKFASMQAEPSLNFSIADPDPVYVGDNLHALHDFFEIVISPDMALNRGYQYYIGPENGRSDMYFVRGEFPEEEISVA